MVYSDSKKTKYLKLFVIGSVLYLCIHYYLFLETRAFLFELLKGKFYYIMAGDLLIAMVLAKFLSPRIKVEDADDDDAKSEMPAEDKQQIMRELEEKRRYLSELQQVQLQKAQQQAQQQALIQAQLQAQLQAQEQINKKNKNTKKQKVDETDTSSESSKSTKSTKSIKSDKSTKSAKSTKSSKSTKSDKKTKQQKPKEVKKEEVKKEEVKKNNVDTDTDMPVYE